MSLNSSLQTLGQLMATNLQSKGVTANANDGLTTLANKILQVGPTPIESNLKLTSDKNILSFYDNEYCVLTATLLDSNGNGVSGEEIVFKANGGVLGTVITGDNGVAQYTYQSTGVGDVTITAGGMGLQGTCSIEDCLLYDVDGFSKTTTTSTDTDYDSGYEYSLASISDFEMEFDFNNPLGFRLYFSSSNVISTGQNILYGIGFGRNASGKFVFTERTTTSLNTTCQSISSGTNHYKIKFNGNVVNVWVNDVQQITNKTLSWWNAHFPYYFDWAIWEIGTGTVNNIKIKQI